MLKHKPFAPCTVALGQVDDALPFNRRVKGARLHNRQRLVFLLMLAVLMLVLVDQAGSAPEEEPPNIVLIVTDDQRWDTMGTMTTVMGELAQHGTTFANAYVTTALCSPSRASILTGRYAHNHGVLINSGAQGGQVFDESQTIGTLLKAETDYHTAYLGKYLHGYKEKLVPDVYMPPGWDDWYAFGEKDSDKFRWYYNYDMVENGEIIHYGAEPEDYSTDVLTAKAVDIIKASGEEPFFLHLNYFASHTPFEPAPIYKGTLDGLQPARPPNFDEPYSADKPSWYLKRPPLDADRTDTNRQGALETLPSVDDGVAAIINALESIGERNNTVIIFTSDNGLNFGEHRLSGKECPYEECIHVPMIIVYPGVTGGGVAEGAALNIDLAPTIAELAGVPAAAQPEWDGRSLLPLLDQNSADTAWREDFLVEHGSTAEPASRVLIPHHFSLHSARWTYVEYPSTGERELYDRYSDPYQLHNRVRDSELQEVVSRMSRRLANMLCEANESPYYCSYIPFASSG